MIKEMVSNMPELLKLSPKFIRRVDLTVSIRLYIACTALQAKEEKLWGVVSALARQFQISRTFVYMLVVTLEQTGQLVFGHSLCSSVMLNDRLCYRYMLSLRLEGRCSIGAISTMMTRFDVNNSSEGKISQSLQSIGALLPNTLRIDDGLIRLVVFLSDELFAKKRPILVTVDPQSSALLRIELVENRQWEQWKAHWECLEDNGVEAMYLVCDGGQALSKAQKESLKDIFRQPDTYHAIAHQFGTYVERLKKAAYSTIEQEDTCWRTLDSARSERVIEKRIDTYEAASNKAGQRIARYENYAYLYRCLVEELLLFDENGELRSRQEAEGNIEAALELLDSLDLGFISTAVKKVRRILPDLLNFFEVAPSILSQLGQLPLEPETLGALCLAWQWHKGVTKAKDSKVRQDRKAQEQFSLDVAADELDGKAYEDMKAQVYQHLDRIVQSSGMVECLNSLIRPYLNTTKNHVTQELLNLVMFSHNHRRYKAGKREGKTPMELLTGTPQEKDWIDLVFEEVEKKQPGFFDSSR